MMLSSLANPCALMAPMVAPMAGHRQFGRQLVRHIRRARMTTAPKRFAHGATPIVLAAGLAEEIEKKNAENAVVVYSKTYCTRGGVLCVLSGVLRRVCLTRDVVPYCTGPYCTQVKSLFGKLGVSAKVIELDEIADGADIQATLSGITGRSTVPQVFIGGQFVGGCDDTMAAHNSGKLKELFASAGVSV